MKGFSNKDGNKKLRTKTGTRGFLLALCTVIVTLLFSPVAQGFSHETASSYEKEQTINGLHYYFVVIPQGAALTYVSHAGLPQGSFLDLLAEPIPNLYIPDSLSAEGGTWPVVQLADSVFATRTIDTLRIPSSVTHIGVGAFQYSTLTDIILPNSLTYISKYAFLNSAISKITFPEASANSGNYPPPLLIDSFAFQNVSQLKTISFEPADINHHAPIRLEFGAFRDCPDLESVTLNGNVEYIGDYAFKNCNALDSIDFTTATSLTDMGELVFEQTKISTLDLSKTALDSIRANFSRDNTYLTSVSLSPILKSIGNAAFKGCTSLSSVNFISKDIVAFNYFSKDIVDLKFIDKEAFFGCSQLTTIDLSKTQISTLWYRAFAECIRLDKIFLPATFDTVACPDAFYNTRLSGIYLLNPTPPFIFSDDCLGFGDVNINYHPDNNWPTPHFDKYLLYVPTSAYDSYTSDRQWSAMATESRIRPLNTYPIRLIYNFNKLNKPDSTGYVVYGDTVALPTAIASPDANEFFLGWYDKPEGGIRWPDTLVLTTFVFEDLAFPITLYACWTPEPTIANITFNANGGTGAPSLVHHFFAETIYEPTPVPTRENYIFDGWYDAPRAGVKFIFPIFPYSTQKIERDTTFYAQWIGAPQAITYNLGTGTDTIPATYPDTIRYNEKLQVLTPDPTRPGYTFTGWYTDSVGETRYDFPVIITAPIALFAHWTPVMHTISYDLHQGIHTGIYQTIVLYNDTLTEPKPDPERNEYIFQGWYTDATDGSEYIFPLTITCDTTLHARWDTKKYDLTLTSGVGIMDVSGDGEYIYNDSVIVSATVNTADGYVWDGWYNDSVKVSTANPYMFDMPGSAITLEARAIPPTIVVIPPSTYTLTLTGDDGIDYVTDCTDLGEYDYNDSITVNAHLRLGYVFDGWYDDNGNRVSIDTTYTFQMPARNYTLKARTTVKTYTVELVSNPSSTTYGAGTYAYNDMVTVKANIAEGRTFMGWFDRNSGQLVTTSNPYIFYMPQENVSLEARTDRPHYNLVLLNKGDLQALENISGAGSYLADTIVEIKTVVAPGYTWNGWYDTNNNLVSIDNPYLFILTGNLTLEARATLNHYSIDLIAADEGSTVSGGGREYAYGTNNTVTATLKTGYSFDGWYENNTKVSDSLSYTFTLTAPRILEARTTINSYPLTLTPGTGIGSVFGAGDKTYKSSVIAIAELSTGYSFDGWYERDTRVSTNLDYIFNMPPHSVALEARATINSYTLTLINGHDITRTTGEGKYEYDATVTVTASVFPGATWDGWYDGNTRVSANNPYTFCIPDGDLILQARTAIAPHTVTFNSNGSPATPPTAQSINDGSTVRKPIDPTFPGYTFTGWYTNMASAGAQYDFNTPVTNSFILYVQWNLKTYSVIFKYGDGGLTPDYVVDSLLHESYLPAPTEPFRPGYAFLGWFTETKNGYKWDFHNQTVSNSFTLYAHWTPLAANTNGDNTNSDNGIDYTGNETIGDGDANGYDFNGYDSDAAYYDLQGRRVLHPTPGRLYIIYSNGEKHLIMIKY